MAQEIVHLTPEGFAKFQNELDYLRTTRREEVAAKLRNAREDGVYGENFGYENAIDEQAFVEGRIQQLEGLLGRARVIHNDGRSVPDGVVYLNCMVTIQEEGYDAETFHLVGSAEADPRQGRISDESPLGSKLLGKRVGDDVRVAAPAGDFVYRIIAVE